MDAINIAKEELVEIANEIANGYPIDLNSIRRICVLRFHIGAESDPIFIPLRGVESETDEFPIGVSRDNYSKTLLAELDRERDAYLNRMRNIIIDSCHEILRKYSK